MKDEMTDLVEKRAPLRAGVSEVADNFISLMRTFNRTRARILAAAAHDVEWSTHVLLRCIRNDGPMRASSVAGHLQSDPSTVSRQVAALVKEGLLERRSDPDDGRASLLVLTSKADAVLAEHDRIRLEYFARMLDGWSDADLRRFAGMLSRFAEAYEATDGAWINDRIATRSGRGSN
jgi:DNA-binding MarR family transcriptional regulator